MLRLHFLVVLTVATFAVTALLAAALVTNLASARTAGQFRALSPIAVTSVTSLGEIKAQHRFSAAQQLRPTL